MQKNNLIFYLTNIIFIMFPLSIILGNFAINLNILILLLVFIIFFLSKKEKIKLKINSIDKSVIVYFCYTLVTLIINYIEKLYYNQEFSDSILTKTLLYQKYLILYFVIRILLINKIIKINWFIAACAACAIFISLDIYFQFIFGQDFFGIVSPSKRHYSAIFGDELIAGGYLQRFGLFILFFLYTLKKNSIFKKKNLIITIILLLFISIILSGNRVPLFMFLLACLIYLYIIDNYKKIIKKILLIFFFSFFVLISINKNLKIHFYNFYNNSINLISIITVQNLSKETHAVPEGPYIVEFNCSITFIKKNPFIGGGIRSYRHNPDSYCYTHSHNYYLEILVDLGVIGLIIIICIIFLISKKIYLNFKNNINLPSYTIPFIIILTTEFFPLRTSGSFFSTNNAIIIFLFLSILVSSIYSKKYTR